MSCVGCCRKLQLISESLTLQRGCVAERAGYNTKLRRAATALSTNYEDKWPSLIAIWRHLARDFILPINNHVNDYTAKSFSADVLRTSHGHPVQCPLPDGVGDHLPGWRSHRYSQSPSKEAEVHQTSGQTQADQVLGAGSKQRRKILTVPFENTTATEFACVQFTFDSKYLVAITGEPDWYLYYYNWDKGKVESHAKAQNPSGLGYVEAVHCNPTDATLVVITGPYTFRIMNVSETVWRQWGWCKAENIDVTTCMWLNPDRIMFGTSTGLIMMCENGELRQNCVFKATEYPMWSELDAIQHIAIDPNQENLLITTKRNQLYYVKLFGQHMLQLRFMVVLIDDFEVMREFPIRNCKQAKFSTNGHLFAAVNGQVVQVFSSTSFNNIYNLKGHNGRISCLAWSANDLVLVSCGTEGAVYEWSMSTGQRIGEVILKTNQFSACAVNSYGKTTYGVGSDGEVKEIGSNTIRRNLGLIGCALDTIVLSRSDMMLFITGGDGGVTTVQLPLLDKAIFNEFHMHYKKVSCIALSYDDQILVSVAEDSSICLWRLTNADGRAIALDKDFAYCKEILISKKDLQVKINNINLLSTRMSELETEHTYQLRQAEATQAEKLKEVHEGYCAAIQELKDKNERTLQALEADFNVRLISEYDRYMSLEDKTARMRKDYEQRLEELAESKRKALREMNTMFETRLEEKDLILLESSIEEDADREIIEIRTAYEVQLKEEKDANVRLKGETGLMKKKLISAHKEIDEFKHQVMQLKAEHKQFQKVISTLERDVADLKKEISERDGTIQDKEKRIYELKRKKQELEKYKFVLNFKITELKNQIEPKQRAISELRVQIDDMENEELKLLNVKHDLELKISQLTEKLASAKKDFTNEAERNLILKSTLKKIKIDLHNMTANFQDPTKLKMNVKALFHKYVEDIDFLRSRVADDEAIREFNRQREHLEKQVAGLKQQLASALGGSKSDINKIMDENCTLLGDINNLRLELKSTRTRCFQMESILGLSARYIPPATARAKLKHVTEDREKLDEKFQQKIEERDGVICALKHENVRLLGKVQCIEEADDGLPPGDKM
ncbi:WD repeat-containing protein 65 [Operophtera brumata]|uniref:WD repeat-containing protein 65 n=1 Tax=Operophtera brumata TaxID=104452 RepID=A0A0L7LDW9_OPEBR|nr:WD repeat-containing protein 65 [Operophtera brumata]